MQDDILIKILEDELLIYLNYDDETINFLLEHPSVSIKERIGTVKDMKIIVYPNDHQPPHFHVKSNDHQIDAKFLIENCELIKGEISARNRKCIEAFWISEKGKIILERVWKKYHG